MKRALKLACVLALAIATVPASAFVGFTLTNDAGGQIRLTTSKCPYPDLIRSGVGPQYLVQGTNGQGEIGLGGCYSILEGQVFVQWKTITGTEQRTYDLGNFAATRELRDVWEKYKKDQAKGVSK